MLDRVAPRLLGRHFAELRSASMPVVIVAAVGSVLAQIAAVVQSAPLWLYVVAALAPWLPVLAMELFWTYRHYRWLALFCMLVIAQATYFLAHVAEAFGAFPMQRVQVAWAALVLVGVALLTTRFPRNPWLWVTLALAVATLLPLEPQLARLALAFVELAAFNVAFAYQLGRTYDAWLARAFPELPERVLIETTDRLEEVRLYPGDRIDSEPNRWYVVTRGRGTLLRAGPGEHEILLRVVGPGNVVREGGVLSAETTLELLTAPSGSER